MKGKLRMSLDRPHCLWEISCNCQSIYIYILDPPRVYTIQCVCKCLLHVCKCILNACKYILNVSVYWMFVSVYCVCKCILYEYVYKSIVWVWKSILRICKSVAYYGPVGVYSVFARVYCAYVRVHIFCTCKNYILKFSKICKKKYSFLI